MDIDNQEKEKIAWIKRFVGGDQGVAYTDAQASEAASNLLGFYSLLLKIRMRNDEKKKNEHI